MLRLEGEIMNWDEWKRLMIGMVVMLFVAVLTICGLLLVQTLPDCYQAAAMTMHLCIIGVMAVGVLLKFG